PRALVRFKREFRAIEHLTHPSLVRLFELGEDDEGLFFTMELVDGEDLTTYLTRCGDVERTESGPALRPSSGATGPALAIGSGVVTVGTAPTVDPAALAAEHTADPDAATHESAADRAHEVGTLDSGGAPTLAAAHARTAVSGEAGDAPSGESL